MKLTLGNLTRHVQGALSTANAASRLRTALVEVFGPGLDVDASTVSELCKRASYAFDASSNDERLRLAEVGGRLASPLAGSKCDEARKLACRLGGPSQAAKLIGDHDDGVRYVASLNAPLAEVKRYLLRNRGDSLVLESYEQRSADVLNEAKKSDKKRKESDVVIDEVQYTLIAMRIVEELGDHIERAWIDPAIASYVRSAWTTDSLRLDPKLLRKKVLDLVDEREENQVAVANGLFTLAGLKENRDVHISFGCEAIDPSSKALPIIDESVGTSPYDDYNDARRPASWLVSEGQKLFSPKMVKVLVEGDDILNEGTHGSLRQSKTLPSSADVPGGMTVQSERALDRYVGAINSMLKLEGLRQRVQWYPCFEANDDVGGAVTFSVSDAEVGS